MRKIIERFVEFPIYANLIIVFVVLAGILSVLSLKKGFFPEVESRFISVSVFYPGASPIEMEEGVTSRIEEAIRGIVGIKEINSTSVENMASVEIETTGEYDINETLTEVKNAVDGVSSLPTAAERPIVSKNRSRAPGMFLAVVPDGDADVDVQTLKDHAYKIEEDFYASGVISQLSVFGFPPLEISVEVKEEELLRYNLTFNDLIRAIQANNKDVSGGEIKSLEEELLIRLRSRSTKPDKIGEIILRADESGALVRIRDVAEVKKKFADTPNRSEYNGKKSVFLWIEKLPEEDLVAITKYVREYVKEFNATENGVRIDEARAFLDILKSRLWLLIKNGVMGLVLIVFFLSMFLNYRLSLWVSVGIPFSFLAMFIFGYLYGLSINMISLFGMILVIGILVDDGIVIAENIFVHFERGKPPMRAAVDGTLEVLPAVFTSVTTTVIAFTPLLLLTGTRMEIMRDVSIVVMSSLLFSLVEAFFILPAHLGTSWVLHKKKENKKRWGIKKYFEYFLDWTRDNIYQHMIRWLIRWRMAVAGVPVFLILIAWGILSGGHIKLTLFPTVDFNRFEINIAFTPGDGEKQTEEALNKIEKAVWEVNDSLVKVFNLDSNIIRRVSKDLGSAFSGQERGAHAGRIRVYPRDMEDKDLQNKDISGLKMAEMVRQQIGPIPEAQKFTVGERNRWGSPVSIGLMSKNPEELELAKDFVMRELNNMPELKDITENIALGKQEVRIKLKPLAYFLGLDEDIIMEQVRQGFYGGQAQRLQEGRDELRVWVRYPKSDRLTLGQMEKIKIKTPAGDYPLISLVDYNMERGPVAIRRFNGQREIRVDAEIVNPQESVIELIERINTDILPVMKAQFPGVNHIMQGQQKFGKEVMSKIYLYFSLAFIFITFIMIIHFKSFQKSLIILLMIPLSILGVIWGHGIHGQTLSFMSLMGIIALTGVIINDAIIFMAKYDGNLIEGMHVEDALVEAGKSRLRPILLTTITTSVGLFPLLLERSVQAQFLIPMAISLAYGVAIGTIFILIFFPVIIMLLNDFRRGVRYIITGILPAREDVEVALKNYNRKLQYEKNRNNSNKS